MDNSKTSNALQRALNTQVDQHMNGNNTSKWGRGTRLKGWLLVLGAGPLLALNATTLSGQESDGQETPDVEPQEEEQQGPPAPEPPLLELPGEGASDPQQELIDLFHSVERKLKQVDLQLAQAGAGVIPLEAPADSGLDDLLRGAMLASEELSSEIDRMLSIAQEMGSMQQQQGQGQGQEGQSKPGESPLDNGSQGEQQGRESTPEGPQESGQQPGQEEGEQEGQNKPSGEQEGESDQPDPEGEDPNSDGENPDDGENLAGDNPDGQAGAASAPGSDAQRWGELPVRVREVFRNQGREDMPVEYRDWIDAYYRRLNKGDR